MGNDLVTQLRRISVLVCDIDGTLTNGAIFVDSSGGELKSFFAKDGSRTTVALAAGIRIYWITTTLSPAVIKRAKNRKINGLLAKSDFKGPRIENFLRSINAAPEEVCYIGDDLNDLPFMRKAGLRVAVADASREIRDIADIITTTPGGRGAVAEIIEQILKAKDIWQQSIKKAYT